jgi:hypothetical protein
MACAYMLLSTTGGAANSTITAAIDAVHKATVHSLVKIISMFEKFAGKKDYDRTIPTSGISLTKSLYASWSSKNNSGGAGINSYFCCCLACWSVCMLFA